jgi:microcystin-dependent protein
LLNDTTESDTVSTGSAIIKGGVGIAKNLNVAGNVTVTNLTTTQNIVPDSNNTRSLGTSTNVWKEVNATTFKGNLEGNVSGTVTGRAGSADKLTSATTFKLTGDVVANDFVFDGQTGGNTKTFTTTISNEIIAAKDSVLESQTDDEILINRTSGDTGLFKISRRNLLSAVPTNPPGVILPYGGNAAPANWLLCDGSQQRISDYPALFEAIGYNFGGRSTLPSGYFKVPDLRGRLPMGADNMGGTSANVVTAESADVIGSTDGSETENILVQNLPEHKHDMRGDSGDQYYALRDVSGTPNDVDAITYDAPTATGNGQALSNSGGVVTGIGESLGTPLNIMNPTITLNYIIYTGRTA